MTVVINGTTGIDTGTGSLIAADATTPTYLDLFEDTDNGSNYVRLIAPTSITSNRTLTLPNNSGTLLSTGSTGTVLQVLQAQKTDTFSTQSQAFVDVTGLSIAITPVSASNKILVMVSVSLGADQHSDLRILRDSTAIAIGDTAGDRTRSTNHVYRGYTGGTFDISPSNMVWLDSPATTSAITYKVQVANPFSSGYTTTINRTMNDGNFSYNGRTVSTITVMEVSA